MHLKQSAGCPLQKQLRNVPLRNVLADVSILYKSLAEALNKEYPPTGYQKA